MIQLTQMNIIPLISFVLYTIILIIIFTSNQTKLSKSFSYYVVAMMIWSLGSFLMKTDVPPNSLFWNKFLQVGFMLVPIFLLKFSYILSGDNSPKPIVRIGYFISSIMIVFALMGYVVKDVTYINNTLEYDLAWGAYAFAFIGSFYSVLALAIMIKKTYNRDIHIKRVRLVIIGLFLVIIGGALNLIPEIGQFGIDILLNTINALLITYSIYRNKFLEINLVVKRGITFSVTNILLYFVYAILILVSQDFIRNQLEVTSVTGIVLIMSPLFLVLEPVRELLVKITKRVFFKATSDMKLALKDFSDLISTSLDLDVITGSLINSVQSTIDCSEMYVLLKNSDSYKVRDASSKKGDLSDIFFAFNHPIITWFKGNNRVLFKNQINNHVLFKGMWKREKMVIQKMNTEIIFPIRYLDELIGFVVVSERKDETPYSFEETEFLQTIINNAAAIIENAKTIEAIKKQSITDELTKFYNHRYFQETANKWIEDNKYNHFALAMIDIDQFKIYNDLYGHTSGDDALKRIAEIIKNNTKSNDMCVRYGGEEFVVLFPNLLYDDSFKVVDHLREVVENEFLLSKDIREFLTISIGVSYYPTHGDTIDVLLSKAETSMQQAKQAGRNKTIIYSEQLEKNNSMQSEVQQKIKDAFVSSIYALAATIDAKDHYTYGHSSNVSVIAKLLAEKLGYDEASLEVVENAGLLHDIGKVGIPESVLSKPGFLDDEEYEIMKGHVTQSVNIIKHIPNLIEVVPIVISHHERFDGKGYPRGIAGNAIPRLGRVLAIADAFDAMTTDRPYRKGLSLEQAVYELNKNAGTQFDPELTKSFIELIKEGGLKDIKLVNRATY